MCRRNYYGGPSPCRALGCGRTTGISKAIAKHTGKPESYVAVSVTDNAAVIFGGSDDPCALGIMGSIGAIAKESNGAITSDVTDLLEEFGVTESRIYINFFDMPREC